ncbi:MAG TPA: MFS transporter [Bryobacteraceae bacterium]|nr:MFS transporter [Bryobacteraceae bacterium]
MSQRSPAFRALQHRNFRIFIGGLAVSLIGTWIQSVALSWLLYRLTHSEFLQGIATLCSHLPVLLLSPLAGLAADRLPRHRIILVTQTIFLCHACLLAYLTLSNRITPPQVLTLAVLLGIANSFDIPARQSLMILLTSKEDLLGAISLNSVAFNTARTLGPSLGGLLVAAVGEGVCFAINAVSFLAVLASLAMLRMPEATERTPHKSVGEGLGEGIRYAWKHRAVRHPLLLCGIVTLTNAPPLVLGPFVADGLFHRGAEGLGLLMASFGLGATVGVARLAISQTEERLELVAGRGALLYGAALAVYAAAPWFGLVAGASFVAGYAFFRQNASNNALIQSTIDERYRGRVMSFYTMMAVGMLPVGSFLTGLAAQITGPRPVLGTAAAIAITAGAAFLYYTRTMDVSECSAV